MSDPDAPRKVDLYTTAGAPCGYYEVISNKPESLRDQGNFAGRVEIYVINPLHKNSDDKIPEFIHAGTISAKLHHAEIKVNATEVRKEIIEDILPSIKHSYESVCERGERNIVYRLARTVAENTTKSEEMIKAWLKPFHADLAHRPTAEELQLHGHHF